MSTLYLFIFSFIFKFLPVSRCFTLKVFLLNIAGAHINSSARIYSNISLYGNGKLYIGQKTFVGHEVIIISSSKCEVRIGDFVDIGPRVYIGTGSHEITPDLERMAGEGNSKSIIIENGCWIGACTTILPGVTIGEKTIIAAGSVVTTNIPAYTIAAGVPCKPIKKWNIENSSWDVL